MTVRADLLPAALAWVSEHFQGGSEPIAWEDATRRALNLPMTDDNETPLVPADFPPADFQRAQRALKELVEVAREVGDDGHTNEDVLVCRAAYVSISKDGGQADLSPEQCVGEALMKMVDCLQYWLTYIPGGLYDATRDLSAAMTDEGFDALMGGTADGDVH